MSNKVPAIPDVPKTASYDRARFDDALKEFAEVLSGRRGGKITPLASTATTADIITAVNALLSKLQG